MNTDEAPALGAVYQAAYQSKGYKVKKFYIKDINVYPIVVDFERFLAEGEEKDEKNSKIRRVLFDRLNPFPQKKVMTFSKHISDFGFNVNYGDLSFLNEDYIKSFGSLNITQVQLNGVDDVFKSHADEESKGIKVHFKLDDSGVLNLDKIDIQFEKTVEAEESTLSKLGNKISSFFSGKGEEATEEEKSTTTEAPKKEEETTPKPTESTTESAQTTTSETPAANTTESVDAKNATAPAVNLTIVKENIKYQSVEVDYVQIDAKVIDSSRTKLQTIKEKEKEKRKRAAAINNLEAFIFDNRDKLTQDEFVKCSTEEEREKIKNKLDEVDMWLSDADDSVETKVIFVFFFYYFFIFLKHYCFKGVWRKINRVEKRMS